MDSISAFDIIKIGIGPSSSHTMGPWRAAELFCRQLEDKGLLAQTLQVRVEFFGSLAKTGHGHGSDIAVLLGLDGEDFTQINTALIDEKVARIRSRKTVYLLGKKEVAFDAANDLVFQYNETLPFHPNGMLFEAWLSSGEVFKEKYYSVGGGFVVQELNNQTLAPQKVTPFPCHNAAAIFEYCSQKNISVSDLIKINEQTWRTTAEIEAQCLVLWHEIKEAIFRGCHREGILPGGLKVQRRASKMNKNLLANAIYTNINEWLVAVKNSEQSFTSINKWITCFALAVNEENASFGRVVTAPTNGAAGVVPAVLMYAYCFTPDFDNQKIIRFLLTAGEIGTLFKKKATISAAMGGCQAEIGVSSSMAAAGLTEALGASVGQVLMAAEIAMEHHLGMTCDPIGGLVQIPCIERNSMGAIKAITASNIAFESDPAAARVSLDEVIKSMWETAQDMNSKYKETAEGGLAVSVNVAEC